MSSFSPSPRTDRRRNEPGERGVSHQINLALGSPMREMGMREGTKEEQERRGGAIGETAVSYLGDGRSACYYCYMTMHGRPSSPDRRDAACRRRRGTLSIHLQRLISCGGLCTCTLIYRVPCSMAEEVCGYPAYSRVIGSTHVVIVALIEKHLK